MEKLAPLTSIDRTYVGLPPWRHPPKDARMVEQTGSVVVVAGGAGEVIVFEVPGNLHLVIHQVGFSSRDGMGTMLGTWSVKASGEPIEGYHHIPAAIGTIDAPAQVQIIVPGRKTFAIEVQNNAYVNAYTFVARIAGWLYRPNPSEAL